MAKIKLIYIDNSDDNVDLFCNEYQENYVKEDENVFSIPFGEYGWRENRKRFKKIVEDWEKENKKLAIITNDVTLLQCINIEADELWFWKWNGELKNVLDVYPNLRRVNNLMKMYMTGMFEEVTDE